MPKLNTDYSNTIIYEIVCNDLNVKDIYVGHTTKFTKRKSYNKNSCHNVNDKAYKYKVYETIRNNGGWNNWSMNEIDVYDCKNKNEAIKYEQHWYERLEANLNMCNPIKNKEKYQNDNKEKQQLKKQEYYRKNKEKIKEKVKLYRNDKKDEISEKKKIYHTDNKEILKEYHKKYYNLNNEALKRKRKQYYKNSVTKN